MTTRSLPRWRAWIIRLGHRPAVAIVTAVSVVLSLVMTSIALSQLLDTSTEEFLIGLGIAVVVPSIVAPIVGHITIGLVLDLDRAQTALARLAALDALTGVFNRGHFMERLEAEAGRHFRTGDPLTLLMLDADHFKAINDTFGHSTGDRALIAIAQTASAALREGDVFARYGGEEFVALLPSTTRSEGIELAERVRTAVAALSVTSNDGRAVPVTVSIGVSVLTSPDPECRRLFDSADGALYEAKRGGRNRCVVAERATRAA